MPREIQRTKMDMKSVSPSSRYSNTHVINYDGKLAYPIYRRKVANFSGQDKHFEITKEVAYRPDLVSYRYYGAPDYWWKIMEMNGMKDILEFAAGRNIILPGGSVMY